MSVSSKNYFVLLKNEKLSKNLQTLLPLEIAKEIKSLNKSDLKVKFGSISKILNSSFSKKGIKLFLVGTYSSKLNTEKLRILGHKIAKAIQSEQINEFNLVSDKEFEPEHLAQIYHGIENGNYKFDNFLTSHKAKKHKFDSIYFISLHPHELIDQKIAVTKKLIQSINYVKDLVNTPSLSLTPSTLASEAQNIAKKSRKIKIKVLNEKDLINKKLNLIYYVGLGSGQDSKLIQLEHLNGPKNQAPILIVGKGVTFDAGGLNLKPTNGIENMKNDMAGAATVLGLFNLLASVDLPLNIIGVIPSVENLLGHNAYKPGDILTAYNGKTIEITNTDAEGRLILADAISYSIDQYNPAKIIDIATLTGACIVALGNTRTGVLSNNKSLVKQLWKASQASGDQIWPLPIDQYHRDKVKGDISDYKNWTAGVNAGAIMGGAFIEKFVQKKPWAHLDIAGTSHYDTSISYYDKGATGQPLNLLFEYLKSQI